MISVLQDDNLCRSSHEVHERKKITTPIHEITIGSSRRVSFSPYVVTHEVLNRDDYTADEMQASWLNIDEMNEMKQTARIEARLVEAGFLVHCMGFSTRGLEARMKDGHIRKKRSRINAYAAVYSGIVIQEDEDFYDEGIVSEAYHIYSKPCAIEAQLIGIQDELEAMMIHDENDGHENEQP